MTSLRLLLTSALLSFLTHPLAGQLEPPSTGGIVALDQELRMLGHYKRALMIGAHPDDEDTELLTVLVRGMGAEAAYLSLNRGEGGQNLIGAELGEALGLIRTEELLAARRLDGARQYFTRAYDFGFSKTLEETWSHWPRDTILKDVVRIVRRFRPQVIVSVFSGTPRDGHGQHQVAGWVSREAFRVAADSTRFAELEREEGLTAWAPIKLYRSTRFDTTATSLTLDGGVLDPAVGKTLHQIAMTGRSLHRSQDMGRLQQIGPSTVWLELLEDRTGRGRGGLFEGIDTTLGAMPWAGSRKGVLAQVDSARRALGNGGSPLAAALLGRAERDLLGSRPDSAADLSWPTPEQADQLRHLSRAAAVAAGLVGDAVADDDRVVSGQRLSVAITAWNGGRQVERIAPALSLPAGWKLAADSLEAAALAPGAVARGAAVLVAGSGVAPFTPYFLRRPLQGALYDWSATAPGERGEPFDTAAPFVRFLRGQPGGGFAREVTFRTNDQARGEIRRPLAVVPRVDVKLDPATELWSTSGPAVQQFSVTLTHGARDTTAGTVGLEVPAGWPAVKPRAFRLTREDEREVFTFEVRPPASRRPGTAEIRAVARDERGARYALGVFTVDYPHIRPRTYVRPATATIRSAPLALPPLTRVGYVRGAADLVPEALQSVGIPVVLLDAAAFERGGLDRYDAIVIGPRAYETDPAVVEHNARLLQYARQGGLVIVQYQQHRFFDGKYAPFPLTVGGPRRLAGDTLPTSPGGTAPARPVPTVSHDRVTDETTPVRVVAPGHPVVLRPNRLSDADWRDWVQERGLYFARSWDPAYRPVLETHDPGEVPLEGGLLVATVGRGTYVYTGLSFFRQLPAGVPGAFRLFANLLALAGRSAR